MIVVGEHCRNDTTGAVGRRGNNAAAGGVLFVDRQREHVHPVDNIHRVVRQLIAGDQQTTQRRSATRHAQRPRQHTFGVHAAIDTGAHGLPDVFKIGLDLLLAVQRQFVLHHHAGERQTGFFAVAQHFLCRFKRIRNLQFARVFFAEMLFVDDKTAAD